MKEELDWLIITREILCKSNEREKEAKMFFINFQKLSMDFRKVLAKIKVVHKMLKKVS